jgi:threonine aldolase
VRTNVVTWRHPDALALVDQLAGEGVRAGTIAPGVVRLVTHHDVDDAGVERAVKALLGAA